MTYAAADPASQTVLVTRAEAKGSPWQVATTSEAGAIVQSVDGAERAPAGTSRFEREFAGGSAEVDTVAAPPAPPAPPAPTYAVPTPPAPTYAVPTPPAPPAPPAPPKPMKMHAAIHEDVRANMEPVVLECGGKRHVISIANLDSDMGERAMEDYALCVEREALADACKGLESARAAIASDAELPAKLRRELLAELDAELADLKRRRR